MQDTKKTAPHAKTPERGTAAAAEKERGKPADQGTQKEGASARGREPITTQNRTSSEE